MFRCWLAAILFAIIAWHPGSLAVAQTTINPLSLLPPPADVKVRAHFEFQDVLEVHDDTETFEFVGVLTLTWYDPRQAFDPALFGAAEKVFTGSYQFNEVSTGWYPEVVLINASGEYDGLGVVLRISPDGTSTLTQAVAATAEVEFDMALFPFDAQTLEAQFVVLGGDVPLGLIDGAGSALGGHVAVPQWHVIGSDLTVRERVTTVTDRKFVSAAFVASVDVERKPLHVRRLVVFPLGLIVLLSFSVFWMDRESLGDRVSVSFIGILTGVTYQLLIGDSMPRISYITLIHSYLMLSFITMCSTVVVNLVVGALDRAGNRALGDRVDYHCRWGYPTVYFGLIIYLVVDAFAHP